MKEKKAKQLLFPPRALAICAMLAAMSIVCGKYLAIPLGNVMRFSFENLPIIMAGMMFGAVAGALTGVVADLFGCLLVGYTINPIVTLGAFSIGLVSGIFSKHVTVKSDIFKIILCVVPSHILGSIVIKTFGLAAFYSMPFFMLMLWRALNYLIVAVAEILVLHFISKNSYLKALLFTKDWRKL